MNLDVNWSQLLLSTFPDAHELIRSCEIEKIPRFYLAVNLKFVRKKTGHTLKSLSEAVKKNSNGSLTLHLSNIARIEKMEIDATVSTLFKLAVGLGLKLDNWHQLCNPLGFDNELNPVLTTDINYDVLIESLEKAYKGMKSTGKVNIPKLATMSVACYKAQLTGDYVEFEKEMIRIASI